jgi:hypothetical protein
MHHAPFGCELNATPYLNFFALIMGFYNCCHCICKFVDVFSVKTSDISQC